MADEKTRIVPAHTSYTDDRHTKFTAEVSLPGVAKDKITLKMREDSFYLSAPKDGGLFVLSQPVCHLVLPRKALATFEDGLLKVVVPFKQPLHGAVDVRIE
jgi:HSP20 family protein